MEGVWSSHPLLEGRTRFLIENPEQVLIKGADCFPGKNSAKVHIAADEAPKIFRLLFERGVIDFVEAGQVYSDNLFSVECLVSQSPTR